MADFAANMGTSQEMEMALAELVAESKLPERAKGLRPTDHPRAIQFSPPA